MAYNFNRHNSIGGNWSIPPNQRTHPNGASNPPAVPGRQNQNQNENPFIPSTQQSPGFRNPWFNSQQGGVPLVPANGLPPNQPPQQQAGSNSPTKHNVLLQQTPPRHSFANQLPITYEYDILQQQQQQQQQQFIPPTRADNPFPYYNSQDVSLQNSVPLNRRSSIAVTNYQQQLQQNNVPYGQSGRFHARTASVVSQQYLPIPRVHKIKSKLDLNPVVNSNPKYRRASINSTTISPLVALTLALPSTFQICQPNFDYKSSTNPRRVLTKPSEPKFNNGYDNEDSDYILYVNDILGSQDNKKYIVLDILGQGTFGQVVKCQNLMNQEIVAIKVIKSKPAYLNQSLTEVSILEFLNKHQIPHKSLQENLQNPEDNDDNFIRLRDKFIHKEHLCLVFELLSSNLYELIKQNQFNGLSIKLVKIFAKQLLTGLIKLKDSQLIHCDLKPENILLFHPDKPLIKIIDLGSACFERQTLYTYIQSRFYRCPEVMLGLPYTTSIDVWSFGCIVAELFLGLPLFPGTSEYNQISRIVKMLGSPPSYMLEMGKNTSNFFNKVPSTYVTSKKSFQLKDMKEYAAQFPNLDEKPNKDYFRHVLLKDIILNYKLPSKKMTSAMIDKEKMDRLCLIDFLNGVLNLNPLERWTPHQAILHPFVNDSIKFTGNWKPPGPGNISGGRTEKSNNNRNSNNNFEASSSASSSRKQDSSPSIPHDDHQPPPSYNASTTNNKFKQSQYFEKNSSSSPLIKSLSSTSSSDSSSSYDSTHSQSAIATSRNVNSDSNSNLSFVESGMNSKFTSVKSLID